MDYAFPIIAIIAVIALLAAAFAIVYDDIMNFHRRQRFNDRSYS